MKMKNKFLLIIEIIVFVLIISIGQVNATNEIGDKITIDTTSWTDVLVTIISFINLLFVIWFYFNDQKNNENDKKVNYKFFWYKDYVLKDAIKIIEEHLQNCKTIIEECKEYKLTEPSVEQYRQYLTKMVMWKFNESNNNTKKRLSQLLKMIDGNMSNEIINEFRNIQDIFTETITNITENLDSLYGKIAEKKPQLMNTLYKYGLDIIK